MIIYPQLSRKNRLYSEVDDNMSAKKPQQVELNPDAHTCHDDSHVERYDENLSFETSMIFLWYGNNFVVIQYPKNCMQKKARNELQKLIHYTKCAFEKFMTDLNPPEK